MCSYPQQMFFLPYGLASFVTVMLYPVYHITVIWLLMGHCTSARYERGLTIIPVINKIDLPTADVEKVTEEMVQCFDVDPAAIIYVSAKSGVNMELILPAAIQQIPHPPAAPTVRSIFSSSPNWVLVDAGLMCAARVGTRV